MPPYLKIRIPNLGALYAPGGLHMLPAIQVRSRDGQPFRPGLDAIERVVKNRGDWQRLLGERALLDHIALLSGGHLRDLLRILADVLDYGSTPAREQDVRRAEMLLSELRPDPAMTT